MMRFGTTLTASHETQKKVGGRLDSDSQIILMTVYYISIHMCRDA